MNKVLQGEVSKPVVCCVVGIVVVVVAWYGWNALKTDGERRDGRAIVDAAARHQAEMGIDIKTVPTWSAMWYKYHPEYKGPHPPVKMPEVNVPVPGSNRSGPPAGDPGALAKPGSTSTEHGPS